MVKCTGCGAQSADGKRYCADCGAPVASATAASAANIRDIVRDVLKEHYADQKVVEIETAQAVATRLSDWGKLFGYFLAVPAAIFLIVLSALGFKTFQDFGKKVGDADVEVTKQIDKAKADVGRQIGGQQKRFTDLNAKGAALDQEYLRLQQRLAYYEQLDAKLDRLTRRVDVIDEKFGISSSSQSTPRQNAGYSSALDRYSTYLKTIGYAPRGGEVLVEIQPDMATKQGTEAFYDTRRRTMVIDTKHADDHSYLYREYMHHVLYQDDSKLKKFTYKDNDDIYIYYVIESALASYFPASFQGDPAATGAYTDLSKDTASPFSSIPVGMGGRGAGTRVWGGALWQVRQELGDSLAADRLIYRAWLKLNPAETRGSRGEVFAKHIIDAVPLGKRAAVRQIFANRGLRL
jgi:hypothetical protein